jgi:hypothetical protein
VAEGTAAELKSGLGVGSLDEVFLALTSATGNDMATMEVTR